VGVGAFARKSDVPAAFDRESGAPRFPCDSACAAAVAAAGLKSAAGAAGVAAAAAATAAGTGDRFAAHVPVRWQADPCDDAASRLRVPVVAPGLAVAVAPAADGSAGVVELGSFEQVRG